MPLHAQIACIGGNALFALIFALVTLNSFMANEAGLAIFFVVLTTAAIYTCWVLVKFRKFLSAEESIARELRLEQLREEIDRLKANNVD